MRPWKRFRTVTVFLAGFLALWSPAFPVTEARGQDRDASAALLDLREGRYEEALSALHALSRADRAEDSTRRLYARALMEVGRYEDAAEELTRPGGQGAISVEVENVLGEAL